MELLEYQAKKLFHQVGIPVLPSETIANPQDLKQLQIPYPVVLKSQVKAGGRGKAGGVKFVTNTIDAIAQARNIFNLSILGDKPEVILAEAHYKARQELFLGIVLDYERQCPVIFGSSHGGMDVELLLENLQQVAIEKEFFPFLARHLAVMMGLSGDLLLSVSEIIVKMYRIFCDRDLDLIEINPLAIGEAGQLMALDGKMTLADRFKSDLDSILPTEREINRVDHNLELAPSIERSGLHWLNWFDPRGKIVLVTNSNELALLNWDLLSQQKARPACAVTIDENSERERELPEQLQQILARLQTLENVEVLLINLWSSEAVYQAIAKTLLAFCQPKPTVLFSGGEDRAIMPANSLSRLQRSTIEAKSNASQKALTNNEAVAEKRSLSTKAIKFVIRLAHCDLKSYQSEFAHEALVWVDNLEDAISEAVSYSQTK